MYEITTVFTRPNKDKEFFIFQTEDANLLKANVEFRREMAASPGFIGSSFFVSQDGLQLRIQLLWESNSHKINFISNSKTLRMFNVHSSSYNTRNGVIINADESTIIDPKYLKDKKLSTRLTVEEAKNKLLDFLSRR